ncbi:MAG: group II intron reverse transcriptase/maturase [Desulfobacterales bacterium]|nr:group II intron reverse transcriptase/maturase [Desulfobacterales bacterium]
MQTSLRRIAEKSVLRKEHRFRNLMREFTPDYLRRCYFQLNKNAAPGVDKVTVRDYGRNLSENISGLVERLKRGSYRAKLILRRFIPKPGGKKRPPGLPVTEDKVLQTAAAKLLEAIYEPMFRNCSFGYRPHIGPGDAVKNLSARLQSDGCNFVVEADIRSFFDSINHDILIEMLKKKIDDRKFLRLIRKWLNAGILENDGKISDPVTGTPQGGTVSPILANIYLHYALDEWFEDVVRMHCKGKVCLCRYADDFVCAFQHPDDAEKFFRVLSKRLEKFGLSLADEKTRIIRFSSLHMKDKSCFEFPGFEFRRGTDRKGRPQIQKRTSRKKFRASLKNFSDWCKKNRHLKMTDLFKKLNAKLRGYYNYYGVIGNYNSLSSFFFQAVRILFKWLNRRSQRKSYNWKGFCELLKYFSIEKPRITEKKKRIQMTLFNTVQSA